MPSTSIYPRARYNHAERKDMLVHDAEQESKLGPEWELTPFPPLVEELPPDPIQKLQAEVTKLSERVKALENGEMLRARAYPQEKRK